MRILFEFLYTIIVILTLEFRHKWLKSYEYFLGVAVASWVFPARQTLFCGYPWEVWAGYFECNHPRDPQHLVASSRAHSPLRLEVAARTDQQRRRGKFHPTIVLPKKYGVVTKPLVTVFCSYCTSRYFMAICTMWFWRLQFCKGSCPAQAWSVGCLLEVLYDLQQV